MKVRYFGHDGRHHYFTGTANDGTLQWDPDEAKAFVFSAEFAAQRIATKAHGEGLDVSIEW